MFSVDNKFRRFCQYIVAPSYGQRFEGQIKPTIVWNIFWGIMLAATFGLIVIAAYVTPIYYQENLMETGMNWYVITETIFFFIFTAEVVIKVVADGFMMTPNAYLKSVWGVIDFFVWLTLIANIIQEVFFHGQNTRVIRAFKALRALRLLSVNTKAQELFHSIIIVGIWKLFAASLVALSLLFPFSVWGLNVFRGRLFSCNDGSFVGDLSECVGEFGNVPFNWEVLSPRKIANSYYDFDSFGHSFLILFEIISLEGWVDVLVSAMSITGPFEQPQFSSSSFRGFFFIVYNIVSTIFILTLFLSVIIQNFAKSSGTAYFTDTQRMWYELEKSLKTVRPSIRPPSIIPGSLRAKMFKSYTTARSWVNWIMFLALIGIAAVLMSEFYPISKESRSIRWSFLMFFISLYMFLIFGKCYAFGPRKYFRRKWDLYAFIVTMGAVSLKMVAFFLTESYSFQILEKLFYVGMLLLIIPHSRRLDQLLKTAAASIPNMAHLLLVWSVLYFVFGIALNQVFGLTRLGPNGSTTINFRTVPNSLVLLFRMSCGEGWNQVMADYIVQYPECFIDANGNGSDCGSKGYAYVLFCAWNILSLYIFANLLVSMIFEQFSYLARPEEPPINRNKIRQFKAAWFEYDLNSRGYIEKSSLRRFLSTLDGYFSTKIHHEPWTVKSILHDSRCLYDNGKLDFPALRQHMRKYPMYEVAQFRQRYEQFYYHALELADEKGRIPFHKLLLLFPFYNDMDYTQCLNIRDYLHYSNILDSIKEKIQKEREEGFREMVKMMLWKRVLLRRKREDNYRAQAGAPIPRLTVTSDSPVQENFLENTTNNSSTLNDPFEDSPPPYQYT